LHQKLRGDSHPLQEVRGLITLGAYPLLDVRQNTALPTADMSRPCDNIPTCEIDAASQPAEPVSHDLSGGHSTGVKTLGTGTGTGDLRQRAPTQLLNEYRHTYQYDYPPGMHVMSPDSTTPLLAATWDMIRWESARGVLSSKIVAGEADSHSVDNDLQPFISRVDGTMNYQCMVPIYDSQGRPGHCGYQMQRKVRILGHVKHKHLQYRPFACGGRCGSDDW
jgi:hypothetical protein